MNLLGDNPRTNIVTLQIANNSSNPTRNLDIKANNYAVNGAIEAYGATPPFPAPKWQLNYISPTQFTISVPGMNLYWTYPDVECIESIVITLQPLNSTPNNTSQVLSMADSSLSGFFLLKNANNIYIASQYQTIEPESTLRISTCPATAQNVAFQTLPA